MKKMAAFFLLVFLLGIPVSVFAQQPTPSDDQVNELARQLYCPVCDNIPLDTCPTRACEQWRALIREKLQQGWTDEQIKQFFAEQYGEQVLEVPSFQGPNRLMYIVPVFLFLLGGFYAIKYIRKIRSRKNPALDLKDGAIPPDDPYIARVEEELGHHRK